MSTVPPPETPAHSPGGRAISLDDLIALNDEIAALTRAGMPLESGLLAVGGDGSGRLSEIARALAGRMAKGMGLAQALEAEGGRLPKAYRATVEAGIRAGRLPAALEGLAGFARSYAETRAAIGLAMLYPLYVLILAYGLFVFFAAGVAPRFVGAFSSMQLPRALPLIWLARLGESAIYWGPIPPLSLVLLIIAWSGTGGASAFRPAGMGFLRWVPWMGGMLVNARASGFAGLLAVLVEHRVPLPEGIELASEASGDPLLSRDGKAIAASLRRGDSLPASLEGTRAFPPLLRWLMLAGMARGALAPALRHAAETYRRRALDRAESIRLLLPTVLLFAVGASATLAYALTLFLPLSTMLNDLAVE